MSAAAQCPSCSDPVSDRHRYCPRCGAELLGDFDSPTGTAPRPRAVPPSEANRPPSGGSPSAGRVAHESPGRERFSPGQVLLERYRVIGLLGRGGMGEVYRADDLKLGQAVALKFLPALATGGAERLERFYNEARMAREVSHPTVCRVHDIGEVEGQPFLSMEYVDGEDLAALVRRIGRLPAPKALEIAQQICAGLHAAHAKGVLHRDLKPQNVMLDGRGAARITDFGLAGLAATIEGDDVRSGTPAYMSPEQLAGREVTTRSDLYALGLVLYEVFTGRKAFPGRTLTEIRRQREEPLLPPSEVVPDLPREAEEAILACLDPDPRRRPPSALAVAAQLAGHDPLAAALSAGETPSPEVVAAAGRGEGFGPAAAWTCVGAIAACVAGILFLSHGRSVVERLSEAKAPAVLEDRARALVARFGYTEPPADRAYGYNVAGAYLRFLQDRPRAERFRGVETGDPPILWFWYRQSPRPLVSERLGGEVFDSHPPVGLSGMVGLRIDLLGRLLSFEAVPPQVEEGPLPTGEVDWTPFFAEAGLDPDAFRPVEPRWTPRFFADARRAWEGAHAGRPDLPLRVEAASHRGRPVFFRQIAPWSPPERMTPYRPSGRQDALRIAFLCALVLLVAAGAFLARRNTRAGRGDRRGAFRLAAVSFGLGMVSWALRAHHVADRDGEVRLLGQGTAGILLEAAVLWLLYLALEPYVRRLWPHTIISWTRLLAGGFRDPLVGRDVLVGAVWGAGLAFVFPLASLVPEWLGQGPGAPWIKSLDAFLGPSRALAQLVRFPLNAIGVAVAALLTLLLLKLLLRRERAAALALAALLTVYQTFEVRANSDAPLYVNVALAFAIMGTFTLLLLRGGLLSAVTGVTVGNCLLIFHMTTDFGGWRGGPAVLALLGVAVLVAWAFGASQQAGSGRGVRPVRSAA